MPDREIRVPFQDSDAEREMSYKIVSQDTSQLRIKLWLANIIQTKVMKDSKSYNQ